MPTVYFDMDGTITNLYEPADWLERLRAGDETLYADAEPLGDVTKLIKRLRRAGYSVGVVSWLAKGSSAAFDARVRQAKRAWIMRHFPEVCEVHLVKYGTPKRSCVRDKGGILIDDELNNVKRWGERAYHVRDFAEVEKIVEQLCRKAA